MQKRLKRRLKRTLFVLVAVYLMIGASLHFFQEKILFLPTKLEQDYTFQFNYPFEELFLKTDKNAVINAIHFKVEKPKGVILYFHGNAGDLSRWGKIAEYFVAMNYDVLIMDYRTYGKSKGNLSEQGFYKDAQFCYDFLLKQYAEDEITIYGRSLGTGIASYITSKNNPRQLVLETPYYSILDVAKSRFPIFPVKHLLKYKFPSFQYLPKTNCSITILHGTEDNLVPYSSGKKLDGLGLKNINFITIEGGSHNDLIEFEAYHKAIKNVL